MVVASTLSASVLAGLWSWRHGAMLNYGDAVAHLHIARRVIDSHRPGLSQLGSVWLPLPHLLLLPFVAVYAWWANGIAGMIPSALAYIAGCTGIYRLARHWLRASAAVVALLFFALNPNLLYLQTTAMTEPLFLCEMVWLAVWLVEWRGALNNDPPRAARLLRCIALVLIAAVFTRYDGWILAVLAWTSVGVVQLRHSTLRSRSFWIASVAVVAAPLLWFAYNSIVFGDWLDFARGPYSAAAIETRTATPGGSRARSVGQLPVEPRGSGDSMGMAHDASPRLPLDFAALAASSLLRVFDCIWLGADFSAGLVATLVVQHPVWNGNAARIRTCTRFRSPIHDRRGKRIQAEFHGARCGGALRSRSHECVGGASRPSSDLCGRYQEHRVPAHVRS